MMIDAAATRGRGERRRARARAGAAMFGSVHAIIGDMALLRLTSVLAMLDSARALLCASLCCRAAPPLIAMQDRGDGNAPADLSKPLLDEAEQVVDLSTAALMHHTSVALVPPDEAWPPIQAARTLIRDRGLWRWPPHANLLYPFLAPRLFFHAAHELAIHAADVEPFDVTLSEMRCFVHSKRSATLWLHPEPCRPNALVELQAALQSAVPHADAQTANHGGVFTAHFTLGHFPGESAALEARDAILDAELLPPGGVRFRVDSVVLMARDGPDAQFEPRWRVRLGRHGDAAPSPIGPYPRDEPFALMPRTMPEFCVRAERRGRRGRGRRRKQAPDEGAGEEEGDGRRSDHEEGAGSER